MALLSEGRILLDDVPGVGKTTLALACSRAMGMDYRRIQFTPDVVPSDIVGFSVYNKGTRSFDYKPGVVMTNLLLADEINRTSSKTQSALLEVMEEGQATVDSGCDPYAAEAFRGHRHSEPGRVGGYARLLPQAQLDRFMIRLEIGYPDYKSRVGDPAGPADLQPHRPGPGDHARGRDSLHAGRSTEYPCGGHDPGICDRPGHGVPGG